MAGDTKQKAGHPAAVFVISQAEAVPQFFFFQPHYDIDAGQPEGHYQVKDQVVGNGALPKKPRYNWT